MFVKDDDGVVSFVDLAGERCILFNGTSRFVNYTDEKDFIVLGRTRNEEVMYLDREAVDNLVTYFNDWLDTHKEG